MDIKERMANVGMTQVDMILELQKRGYAVQPPMMSSILRGGLHLSQGKADSRCLQGNSQGT